MPLAVAHSHPSTNHDRHAIRNTRRSDKLRKKCPGRNNDRITTLKAVRSNERFASNSAMIRTCSSSCTFVRVRKSSTIICSIRSSDHLTENLRFLRVKGSGKPPNSSGADQSASPIGRGERTSKSPGSDTSINSATENGCILYGKYHPPCQIKMECCPFPEVACAAGSAT